jgi:acyl carrier protein
MNLPERGHRAATETAISQASRRQGGEAVVSRVRPRTPEEVQEWFLSYLAETLQIAPDVIDVEAPFEVLGLDSVTAVGMSGDLQDWLGFPVDPTVVFDYPTIESLASHLAECSRTEGPPA